LRNVGEVLLVHISHADEAGATRMNLLTGAQLGLSEGLGKGPTHAHHLTRGLHLRSQDWINAGELVEGEYCLLDRKVLRNDLPLETLFLESLASHAAGGNLGQRHSDAFRDKWHGSGCTRIDLDDVYLAVLIGQLCIHQADHSKLHRQGGHLLANAVLHIHRQVVRRQRAGRIARVYAGLFNVLHDGTDHSLLAVADQIHIDLDGGVEEVIEQHRAFVAYLDGRAHVAAQLFLVVDN